MGPKSIKAIIQHLPQLTHLKLDKCGDLDDDAITALLANEHDDSIHQFPLTYGLTSLELGECKIGPSGMIALAKSQLLDQLEVKNPVKSTVETPSFISWIKFVDKSFLICLIFFWL